MGLIKTIKNKLPFGGQPESNLSIKDFPESDNSSNSESGEDGQEGGENEEEQEGESGSGENEEEQENGEDGENESNESGSGENEEEQENEEDGQEGGENEEEQEGESGSGENEEEQENGEDGENESNESGSNESGESGSNENEDSEIEDMKSEMDNSSAERDMSEWHDTTSDYENPADFVQEYYQKLQEQRAEPETDIAKRVKERDQRTNSVNTHVTDTRVKNEYDSRFADEISEAFRKIKTREAPKAAEYGQRINMRGVVRKRSGDPTEERLYMEMDQSEVGDRCITVVVDGSGSMDELEIKLALMALADACEQIGDRFVATTYDTESTRGFGTRDIRTHLITAPSEKFESEHLNSFNANGYTPTASGIHDGRALADITPNSEDVMIVITDGIANIDMDGEKHSENKESKPMNEASKQVAAAINEGKRVIGLGVGTYLSDQDMEKIFGSSYFRADMDEISDTLVEIYKQQMKTVNN